MSLAKMKILQTKAFNKTTKKLHASQKIDLDKAVKKIAENPDIGEPKKGDLAGVFIYKFKMTKQTSLLAYCYEEKILTLTLLALGTHENFYRDLKK